MRNLTLNPIWLTTMPAFQTVLFSSTLCLSSLAIYLLVKKTPATARPFARYLIFVQASITLVDVTFGLLSRPILLFPLPGSMCNGILSSWFGLSCHVGTSLLYCGFLLVAMSVNFCVHYRHSTIERMVGAHSFTTAHRRTYQLISLATMAVPCLLYVGRYRELESGRQAVRKEFPSLYYLFEKQEYGSYAYDTTGFANYEIVFRAATILNILKSSITVTYFVMSSFTCLFMQKSLSEKTRKMQLGTLRLLLFQTITPMSFLIIPGLIFLYSTGFNALDLDINNLALCVQHLHAFIHTSLLILATPRYRQPFMLGTYSGTQEVSLTQISMPNLTLNPIWLTAMPAYQTCILSSTLCLSALAIYLLIKKTPVTSRSFARYLIFVQVSITLMDVAFGLLARPILLFPLSGSLCNGILSTWFGLSCHVGTSTMYSAFGLVLMSVNFCVHYRHLTIERMAGFPSITTTYPRAYRVLSLSSVALLCLFYFGRYPEPDSGREVVRREFPSLYYLFENPEYRVFAYDMERFPGYENAFRAATFINILMSFGMVGFFLTSAFFCLFKQKSLSEKTRKMQLGILRLLIFQTVTPLAIQLVPAIIFLYSTRYKALDLDINNVVLCIQHLHAFLHTLLLILVTPRYRETFIFWKKPRRSASSMSTQQTRWITAFSIRHQYTFFALYAR